MPGTRKLGRPTAHRMSMLRGMVTFLLEKGRIETTVTRAAEVSALADKMITLGKKNTLVAKRQAIAFLKKEAVVYKLFTKIAPLYDERNGGYTRVLKIGPRRGDGAEMAIIELVGAETVYTVEEKKEEKVEEKPAKKTTKKAVKAEVKEEAAAE
ncbi:MAG: 50S ribosomal protein L17 [Clostridia bacterium]|nr:50S ribosomal protein L17 [Clostridia bacterium]